LKIATADYQGKKADFTDLIDVYQELLTYQVQVARTKATLASTLAQIDKTVGCSTLVIEYAN
jgi:cobalt-zinc-cadmium efflux system outer membrane protein